MGPRTLSDLQSWAEKPGRRLAVLPTSIRGAAAERVHRQAQSWVGRVGYFAWQLAGMWAFERLRIPVRKSPGKVVCSEAVARLVFPELDLRDAFRDFDAVNPASGWRKYHWLKAAFGGFTP